MFRWLLLSIIFIMTSMSATAADIQVFPIDSETAIVALTGPFDLDDAEKFKTKTSALTKAIVSFSSDGGKVIPAIEIGTAIRLKGFVTLVPDDTRCASACALAWLGGATRYMGKNGQVGFHAVFITKDGVSAETSTGNAIVGAYLNRIGLPDRAIVYITQAGPDDMTWLNIADAARQGIAVSEFNLASTSATKTQPRADRSNAEASAPKPQITLTATEIDTAQRLARNFKKRYTEAGMSGINQSVFSCYERLSKTLDDAIGKYCVALDIMASALDSTAAAQMHGPATEFNNKANMRQRTSAAAEKLNQNLPWLDRTYDIAAKATDFISRPPH